jgi:hypothetical protein
MPLTILLGGLINKSEVRQSPYRFPFVIKREKKDGDLESNYKRANYNTLIQSIWPNVAQTGVLKGEIGKATFGGVNFRFGKTTFRYE